MNFEDFETLFQTEPLKNLLRCDEGLISLSLIDFRVIINLNGKRGECISPEEIHDKLSLC